MFLKYSSRHTRARAICRTFKKGTAKSNTWSSSARIQVEILLCVFGGNRGHAYTSRAAGTDFCLV